MGDESKERRRGLAYLRVSTTEQELGPQVQAKAITEWADRNDVEIAVMFLDQGVSGGLPPEKRPAMMAAREMLRPGDVLVVHKRCRLARHVVYAYEIEKMVEKKGATVASTDGIGDGNTPEAGLHKRTVDSFAEYERDVISFRTKMALAVKKDRGEKTGGGVPFGFKESGGKLEAVGAEQATIAEARKLRTSGLSLRKVSAKLEADGHLSRNGRRFDPKQVQRMVA